MKWLLQTNLYDEPGYESLVRAISMHGFPPYIVKVVPFSGELIPVEGKIPPNDSDIMVMGSYTLAKVARSRHWRPGAFLNNLDYELHVSKWGTLMLNHDAKFSIFDKVEKPDGSLDTSFFLRPVEDTKSFPGKVYTWDEYNRFADGVSLHYDKSPHDMTLTPNTRVMACSLKEIWTETRFWIVDKAVVTQSQYKTGTRVVYQDPGLTSQAMIDFANSCAKLWSPDVAYCMDIAETPDGMKIIEVNNLNSAGLYKADTFKLVHALDTWSDNGLPW